MIDLDDYSDRLKWTPDMRPPASFTSADEVEFQKKINEIVGLSKGRPIIKLSWCPREYRWRPYNTFTGKPHGYTMPLLVAGWDEHGNKIAPPRWILMQRAEVEQYGPGWEQSRYCWVGKDQWDAKGPCPAERYTEVFVHSIHDGKCCPCRGVACYCSTVTCWGTYADPDGRMLEWLGWQMEVLKDDTDVKPYQDAQQFESPMAQREEAAKLTAEEEKEDADLRQWHRDNAPWLVRDRKSMVVNGLKEPAGMKRTESGLYVTNN